MSRRVAACVRAVLMGGALTMCFGAHGEAQPAASSVMVVYLPGITNQNPAEVAAAVTKLGTAWAAALPGKTVETNIFKRSDDAKGFLAAKGQRVIFLLCDAAFLQELPADSGLVPALRFSAGGETHRKVVIVKAGSPFKRLSDLKGKSLSAVSSPRATLSPYLQHTVFDDVLVPATFFSRIEPAQDEFAATASVLFEGIDAALVSEQNPLIVSKLGSELRVLHTSPPISLPVLAVRKSTLGEGADAALEKATLKIAGDAVRKAWLRDLRIDGLRLIPDGNGPFERAGLLRAGSRRGRALEVAVMSADDWTMPIPTAPLPAAKDLPFVAALPIPDVASAEELGP
ncbi:MAG: PhnD/SsuA/transferrin family substrate-binding protein [Thermoanaerobaculia bacterium]